MNVGVIDLLIDNNDEAKYFADKMLALADKVSMSDRAITRLKQIIGVKKSTSSDKNVSVCKNIFSKYFNNEEFKSEAEKIMGSNRQIRKSKKDSDSSEGKNARITVSGKVHQRLKRRKESLELDSIGKLIEELLDKTSKSSRVRKKRRKKKLS